MLHRGPTIPVPISLLKTLLEQGTFRGDLSKSGDSERGADYVIAFLEGKQLVEGAGHEIDL